MTLLDRKTSWELGYFVSLNSTLLDSRDGSGINASSLGQIDGFAGTYNIQSESAGLTSSVRLDTYGFSVFLSEKLDRQAQESFESDLKLEIEEAQNVNCRLFSFTLPF